MNQKDLDDHNSIFRSELIREKKMTTSDHVELESDHDEDEIILHNIYIDIFEEFCS